MKVQIDDRPLVNGQRSMEQKIGKKHLPMEAGIQAPTKSLEPANETNKKNREKSLKPLKSQGSISENKLIRLSDTDLEFGD